MPANRDKTGKFIKGKSGNPNGRPKMDEEVKEMLRAATPDAVRYMVSLVTDEKANPKLKLDAANAILDRFYGKASQPIEGSMDNSISIILSKELKGYAE